MHYDAGVQQVSVLLECIYQSLFKGKIFFFLGFSDATSHSMFVAYKFLRVQEKMFLALAIVSSDQQKF